MKNKIELLAPAGNFKCLHAAIKAGADSVYLGLQDWNMRDSAVNFSISDLKEVRKITKEAHVKVYLTLNTIVFDEEIKKVEATIKKIKKLVDAIICWDLGVIELCRKYKIPFHISTQASVANAKSALFYKKLGAERVVLARELNLKQIKKISKIIDVETFCHGAMCVAESGRCFTSQFQAGRSANRGMCTHPCRRAYKIIDREGNELVLENNKVMSAKDLCTLPFIEKLKKAGIKTFKIEGRNREPEYVYTVTKIYRTALDMKLTKQEQEEGMKELEAVYNRNFSSGFYIKSPTAEDFTKAEGSEATKTKQYVGKILHYWDKIGVAAVKIEAGKLKIGDEVIVTGKSTFFKQIIKSMQISKKEIERVEKGREVGIKLERCKEGDEVYIVKERGA